MKPKAANHKNLKEINKLAILNNLRKRKLSRAELARVIHLSRAAVSLLTEEMIEEGQIHETGTVRSCAGRRPILLGLRPDYCYTAGVSIARDKTGIGLVDFQGNNLCYMEIDDTGNAYRILDNIAEGIALLVEQLKIPYGKLLGIGVISPGPVDTKDGRILKPANFTKWHDIDIIKEVQSRTHIRAFLENNANSIAIAEKSYGCGGQFESMIVMTVDTGIGMGVILNNQLFKGGNGFGNEIGHTCVDINGEVCDCGNRGCLELYASRSAVLKSARNISPAVESWPAIVDRAIDGDKACMDIIHRQAEYLATAIVNCVNLIDVDAVIMTGDIVYKPDILLSLIRQRVNSQAIARNMRKIPIIISSLPEHSEILCAASVVLEKYFTGEIGPSQL